MNGLSWSDSGLGDGWANLALDREQEARTRGGGAPLLRFYACAPTASLGAYEDEAHALRPEYCQAQGIPVVRRRSGGGALYLDPGQICWTLTVRTAEPSLDPWLARLGEGVCRGLAAQGVVARFRAPNDIELDGRKLGSLFLGVEDGVLLAQGTLFGSLDVETMLKVLRVPKEKLTAEGFRSAAGHFAALPSLRREGALGELQEALGEALGGALGVPWCRRVPWPEPARHAVTAIPKAERRESYSAFVKTAGGVLVGYLGLDDRGRVASLRLHGNVQMRPHGLFTELQDWLRGASAGESPARLSAFFSGRSWELLRFTPGDLLTLLQRLFERQGQAAALALPAEAVNTIMVHDPDGRHDTFRILAAAEAVLVPYCAKPAWCKWRHRDGCSQCGLCAVGDAYRLARERGLQVVTIRNFEHLEETLGRFRAEGVGAYLGMCCNNFFLKREYAFRAAGMAAVLLDISGSNCYDLGQEQRAYAGTFQAEATLNGPVLEKVMQFVPRRPGAPAPPLLRAARTRRRDALGEEVDGESGGCADGDVRHQLP
ncbi:lipoate--protein ligase family protein [Acidithiobacillus sp.]|uniref:lipoate--protein ligase family protein n=1 Tax=Acidithiobacillus sp. TaxID=1872118 RepID=UPI003CFBFC9A